MKNSPFSKDNIEMNKLFRKLTSVIRKQQGANSNVVPFALGRIYACSYKNWHNDPRPLVLIVGSNAFYTVGINIHYLGSMKNSLTNFVMLMRDSKKVVTGKILYDTMKMRIPMVPRIGFRMYFTSMLRGRLVSEGISTIPEPNVDKSFADPFVKSLQNRIHPPQSSFNKVNSSQKEIEGIRNQINSVSYNSDKQKPFANRGKTVVQYRPQGEEQ